MSERTEHTPTPWKLHTDSQLAITGEGRFIASLNHTHMRSSPVCPKEGEQDANAKLIVKAVNSHERLWPEGSDEEFIRFERFVVENSINRASFIRALIKDYLDGHPIETIRNNDR